MNTLLIGRKHLILQLRKCSDCALQFRFPKDEASENFEFYQEGYQQDNVTDLPLEAEMPSYIAKRFEGVGRDLTTHLNTIREIAASGRVLDDGCSWGYCVSQFRDVGYTAQGFEISRPRVEYGRKVLNVDLTSDVSMLSDASFDLIYSAHCLEHIPNPDLSLKQFQRLLKLGGHLFLYVPNCSGADALNQGVHWGPMIGEKHVLALTAEFFHRNLPKYGFTLQYSSSPYVLPPRNYEDNPPLAGEELLVIGRRV